MVEGGVGKVVKGRGDTPGKRGHGGEEISVYMVEG